jgi:hypothetical protein
MHQRQPLPLPSRGPPSNAPLRSTCTCTGCPRPTSLSSSITGMGEHAREARQAHRPAHAGEAQAYRAAVTSRSGSRRSPARPTFASNQAVLMLSGRRRPLTHCEGGLPKAEGPEHD